MSVLNYHLFFFWSLKFRSGGFHHYRATRRTEVDSPALPWPLWRSLVSSAAACSKGILPTPPRPHPAGAICRNQGRTGGTQDERALSFCVGWTCERCITFWLSTSLKCFSTYMKEKKSMRELVLVCICFGGGMLFKEGRQLNILLIWAEFTGSWG